MVYNLLPVARATGALAAVLVTGLAGAGAAGQAAPSPEAALQAACALDPAATAALMGAFPGGRLIESRVDGPPGQPARSRHRLLMPSGGEWLLQRTSPGGRLRRVGVEWYEAGEDRAVRPVLAVAAGADCRPFEARRLVYGAGGAAETLQILAADLIQVVAELPLNPPVPPAGRPVPDKAVRVALVDTGVNYMLPLFDGRLARDAKGGLAGYDFWDMDDRPFDLDTARSPFFPLHHGTAVASIILREAPEAVILPFRYPRPDMARFKDLVARADAQGAYIVSMAMGSNDRADWVAFADAAKARPHMLFIVSAGNDGRDLDAAPVFPAALDLPNLVSVTSSDAWGGLAPGSNWGRRTVDIMVPGEQVAVTDHRGASGKASGSSFAVPRVAALAARAAARHPGWRAPELKVFLIGRARAAMAGAPLLRHGWIPDPLDDFEG